MASTTDTRPTLTGSPKQVAWAADIRGKHAPQYEAIKAAAEDALRERAPLIADYVVGKVDDILNNPHASWWIDHYAYTSDDSIVWLTACLKTDEGVAVLRAGRAVKPDASDEDVRRIAHRLAGKLWSMASRSQGDR